MLLPNLEQTHDDPRAADYVLTLSPDQLHTLRYALDSLHFSGTVSDAHAERLESLRHAVGISPEYSARVYPFTPTPEPRWNEAMEIANAALHWSEADRPARPNPATDSMAQLAAAAGAYSVLKLAQDYYQHERASFDAWMEDTLALLSPRDP